MAEDVGLYPPAPADVPSDFTRPTRDYRTRVFVVLGSLALFVALYVGLVVGSAYLTYYVFSPGTRAARSDSSGFRTSYRNVRRERDRDGWWIILGIGSGVLCLFLVKGLFKRQRSDPSLRLEVTEKDHPRLFEFIHRVCRDTRAPRPHRVYLTPDVNAAVFYHSSFLSLFLPTPKNLVIGLGLVNRLNLSEFKAVLAHEFGHFSQNSMKLGSYVYTSNRIVADIVYGRDWLDQVVGWLRGTDFRIAVFAWLFTGILWGLRKVLERIFQTINFANSALSRQMEFNADLVAVSVAGSDAIVNGLARLGFANDALMYALQELSVAADHRLYSKDLYLHQTDAAAYLRELHKNPRLGEPPNEVVKDGKPVQIFEPGDDGVPLMWATHPSNHDREINAKRYYLRSPMDTRSPWILFHDVADVREAMSRRYYEVSQDSKQPVLTDPETVQAFIRDERAETTYHPRYQGMYDARYINPGGIDTLPDTAPADRADIHKLVADHAHACREELPTRMEALQQRRFEHRMLSGLIDGSLELKEAELTFRDAQYKKGDFDRLLKQVEAELESDLNWLSALDRRSLQAHYALARDLNVSKSEELLARYRFHLAVQGILAALAGAQQYLQYVLAQIEGKTELQQAEYKWVRGELKKIHEAVRKNLESAHELALPSFKHLIPGTSLGKFLLPDGFVSELGKRKLEGTWLGDLAQRLGSAVNRAQRIHAKSLGGILALQEELGEAWAAEPTTLPADSNAVQPTP